MTIDIEQVEQLVLAADQILMTPEAEKVLLTLLGLKVQIDNAIDEAEKRIEAKALALNPAFKSVTSDNLKIGYRYFGTKYKIDPANLGQLPDGLYKTKVTYLPEIKAIEAWTKDHNGLPVGIVVPERKKQITISLKDKAYDTD